MDTKKLRQKILDLAIHGKLVPQDPNDEPASVLLERIRAEKERLIKEGKTRLSGRQVKRSKKSASDTPHYENRQVGEANEMPFEVPEGWEWTTINDICSKIGSGSTPRGSNYAIEGIPFFRSQNVYNDGLVYDDIKYISEEVHENMIGTEVRAKDLLLNITGGSLGRCAIVPDEFQKGNVSQHVCILRTIIVLPAYLHLFIISDYFAATMILSGSGREGLPKYSLETMQFPLPPIEEQKRIVAAVNKWFALIDTLETAKEDLQTSITLAKSKILDLAIHGKLVPQDPNDEPAIELLKRINPKFTPCDNGHYENVPESWCSVPLGNICVLNEGELISDKKYPYIDVKGLRTGNYTFKQTGKYVSAGATLILVDGENSGEVFHTPMEGYQGSTMKVLDINNNMNAQYVLYFVKLYQRTLRENKVGSAIPHLNKKMFRELIIPIPPIEEQERIVDTIQQHYRILDNISANL